MRGKSVGKVGVSRGDFPCYTSTVKSCVQSACEVEIQHRRFSYAFLHPPVWAYIGHLYKPEV
nr:MAG TPA: hypothetical protein [Caudoviricetes sp.]